MPNGPVVLNNTPLVALWAIGRLDLLRDLFREARLVVVDERKARRYAERLRLPLTGTLGVLLTAKQAGLIDSVAFWVAKLQEEGLFLRPDLVHRVLQVSGELP
jgi:predicted nucleic acid-binding protein